MRVETAEEIVRSEIASLSHVPVDCDPHRDLYLDLGMTSIQALALLQDLEERFGISIPDEQFAESTTVAKLAVTICGLLGADAGQV